MNDVRTKKMKTYNFASGPASLASPLARTGCVPLRASGFNIPT